MSDKPDAVDPGLNPGVVSMMPNPYIDEYGSVVYHDGQPLEKASTQTKDPQMNENHAVLQAGWNDPKTLPHDPEDIEMILIEWTDNMGAQVAPAYWDGEEEGDERVWIVLMVAEETIVDESLITGWMSLPLPRVKDAAAA